METASQILVTTSECPRDGVRYFGDSIRKGYLCNSLPAGSISTWEDLTTHFIAQFFSPGRTSKLRNDILMFQQHQSDFLSEAWTRFKDLLQKVPHHGIDLWLQALLEDLALYDNESLNDLRDFAKTVKAISLPQDVPNASDLVLMTLCMENPKQAFVNYASSRTNEAREVETPKSKEPEKALENKFKDLHLNLPILEVEAHVPIYEALLDKYIESLELGKNRSIFTQGEMPEKMKDPGLFILPYRLGDSKPFDTLADLESCMNLIPLNIFKMLKIGLLEETEDVLGLADRTKSYPVGIVKNVEVHVGKLKLVEDFHVVDMDKDPTCPLLVGRGFLGES
ncbi:MAK10-like protein [Tanacetum coccineum]|uniref:MAK10-like protein n=1 Tax=Tanacetum coccineum TaxID=301880 RepID=A0ABQ4WR92_9ASTR